MAASSSSIPPTDAAPAGALGSSFARARPRVAAALERATARHLGPVPPLVAEAIRYALRGEGKRLRAVLVLEAYAAAGGRGDAAMLAAAIEIVHAYSLVHDDLPCMDDDDMRRGRPTVHRAFSVPVATRAGLAMVPLAAATAADAAIALGLGQPAVAAVVATLMQASGAAGMIGGQLLDLEGEGRSLSLAGLERIHAGKTGALLAASAQLGGLGAGASTAACDALGSYGAAVGLAFQIADDVLDVTATSEQLGKTAGRDAALRKSTYPALLGLEGAAERASALVDEATAVLRDAGLLTEPLAALARFTIGRRS